MQESPYKGLRPYSEEDAAWFFGREQECEIITANLMASRLTLLYGASGVGKSSLLQAGVAHHLRQQAARNLAEYGAPEFAVVVFNSWRNDPMAGFSFQVQESVGRVLDGGASEPVSPARTLTETLEPWAERVGGDLLIILDQFEEYFLYHPEEEDPGTFAAELARAVNRPNLRASFLISIREDALAQLDRFKGRIPNLFDNYLRLEHLDGQAARAAIERPVEQYNARQADSGHRVSIEPGLTEEVLRQVATGRVVLGETGRGAVRSGNGHPTTEARIETPYLQLVMTRIWEEERKAGSQTLRLKTLERLGGAERIVRTHLDEAMRLLPPAEQDAAARVFHHLVTPSGTKIAQTLPDLADYARMKKADLEPLLEKLSRQARILRPVEPPLDRPQDVRYQIFHDVLAPAVLDWRVRFVKAQERAEAEAKLACQREEAERKAEEQRLRAEEQARVAARLRRMLAGLATACAVAIIAAVAALLSIAARKREEIREHKASGATELRDAYDAYSHGYLTVALDRFSEALSQYRLAADTEHEIEALKNMGEIEYSQSDYRGAEERFKQALQLSKANAHDPGAYASLLTSVAKAGRAQRHDEAAEAYLKQALGIYQSDPARSLFTAKVSGELASVYVDQGQHGKAELLFKQALPVLGDAFGPDGADQDYAAILESYAALLRQTRRSREADPIESRVKAIRAKLK